MITINNYLDLLKEKHKDKLYANKRSPSEVINYINSKFNLIKIKQDSGKYQQQVELTKINCLNAEASRDEIKYENMNIFTYEIINDRLSSIYYQRYNRNNLPILPILVMIEENTGYLYSNCNELLVHLILYQGISQEDIDNNTGNLSLYLRLIDEMDE